MCWKFDLRTDVKQILLFGVLLHSIVFGSTLNVTIIALQKTSLSRTHLSSELSWCGNIYSLWLSHQQWWSAYTFGGQWFLSAKKPIWQYGSSCSKVCRTATGGPFIAQIYLAVSSKGAGIQKGSTCLRIDEEALRHKSPVQASFLAIEGRGWHSPRYCWVLALDGGWHLRQCIVTAWRPICANCKTWTSWSTYGIW